MRKKNHEELAQTLFLIDYEFIGCERTGLDLMRELDIATQSILVTSHDEESFVREECLKAGLRLLPKSMASVVPISNAK